jgi:hypothetical protein
MGDEARVVVEDREEVGLPELPLVDDLGTVHAVGLPHVVDEFRFEPPAVFGEARVLFEAVALEEPVEAVLRRSLAHFNDTARPRELHEDRQADARVLLPEHDEGGFELPSKGSTRSPVLPRLGLEGLDPVSGLLIEPYPAQDRRPGDRGSGRAGDLPALGDEVPDEGFLLPPAHAFPAHQGADEGEAEQRDAFT